MSTLLYDLTFVYNHYSTGITHGGKPVGNNKDGSALDKMVYSTLDQALRLGVQLGSSFIKDQNRRIFK